jgi:hypothetical protein
LWKYETLMRKEKHFRGFSIAGGGKFERAIAGGIGGATPKLVAGVGAAPGGAENHRLAALRASWIVILWRGRVQFGFGSSGLALHGFDEGEKL